MDNRSSRMGPLGQGATVVATPQDALTRSNALNLPSEILEEEPEPTPPSAAVKMAEKRRSLAHSTVSSSQDRRSYSSRYPSLPPSPSRRPITPPLPLPPFPHEVVVPAFNPILLEFHPENVADLEQTIVILDTATETHRTTWSTLVTYPSNLSRYLQNLLVEHHKKRDEPHTSAAVDQEADLSKPHLGAHIFLDRPSFS